MTVEGPSSASLDVVENFHGFGFAEDFLMECVRAEGARRVGDIGGGANPAVTPAALEKFAVDYFLFDISKAELSKAPEAYRKVCVDMTLEQSRFAQEVAPLEGSFDLMFSHMFLEHVRDPRSVHRNIHNLLRPGGLAIHFFPSPNNFPLATNRLVPERLSRVLVKISQPTRKLKENEGKFPAYYKLCGAPSKSLRRVFEGLGYEVVKHTGYVGHSYYDALPWLAHVERKMRPVFVKLRIPATSCVLLILRKPVCDL